MNKTISINIGGLFFQIDEEAYKLLENYLNSLKKHFENTEGKEEILQDIESRISEIFQSKIEKGQALILPADVEEAIKILGKPDDIGDSEDQKENKKEKSTNFKKRLYRDEDDKVLGGVCSGLGHYLNIDPVWFRIFFIVALFIFGSSALIYLILWIIIPKATTTEEKLNMKGEPMTISEIQENIENEFQDLKSRFKEMKNDASHHSRREFHEMKRKMRRTKKEEAYSRRLRRMAAEISKPQTVKTPSTGFGSVFGEILYYFLRALLIFVGIVLLIIGIVLTLGLVLSMTASDTVLFFTKWGITSISLPALSGFFFENTWQEQMAVLSLIMLIGVPLLMMIINSIRLILGYKKRIRFLSASASLLWLCGLILGIILSIKIIGSFSEKTYSKKEITLPQNFKMLTVGVSHKILNEDVLPFDDDFMRSEEHERFIFKNCFLAGTREHPFIYGFPRLKIAPSKSGEYKLTVLRYAKGESINQAFERAGRIIYNVTVADSTISLDNYFMLPEKSKWRNQNIRLILEVPEGKSVFLNDDLRKLVYDSDNQDYSWDFSMTGKKMYMVDGRLTSDVVVVTDTVKIIK
ncbi:MAG: PspC domain-containing protein [Bacteroidales bacterium]|jgi:phage shock protein PspC (stress-responsive transcriptional regulator)|nr:PspC domain-containing protein [Bacteroidales bacterium]MDD4215273.1 PspC domain-containing protein [Bacteroidales bacterium]